MVEWVKKIGNLVLNQEPVGDIAEYSAVNFRLGHDSPGASVATANTYFPCAGFEVRVTLVEAATQGFVRDP
jgi:hypothetical protein